MKPQGEADVMKAVWPSDALEAHSMGEGAAWVGLNIIIIIIIIIINWLTWNMFYFSIHWE